VKTLWCSDHENSEGKKVACLDDVGCSFGVCQCPNILDLTCELYESPGIDLSDCENACSDTSDCCDNECSGKPGVIQCLTQCQEVSGNCSTACNSQRSSEDLAFVSAARCKLRAAKMRATVGNVVV